MQRSLVCFLAFGCLLSAKGKEPRKVTALVLSSEFEEDQRRAAAVLPSLGMVVPVVTTVRSWRTIVEIDGSQFLLSCLSTAKKNTCFGLEKGQAYAGEIKKDVITMSQNGSFRGKYDVVRQLTIGTPLSVAAAEPPTSIK